jgi:hypothetical protein
LAASSAGGGGCRSPVRTRADAVIPIVQRAYDVAVALYGYVNRFPRIHKPLLGRELMGLALRLSRSLFLAHDVRHIGKRLLLNMAVGGHTRGVPVWAARPSPTPRRRSST